MHFILATLLATATLALAEVSVTDIPHCALPCFLQGVGNSTCAVTDALCQCTTQAAKIGSIVIPCLCATDCVPADLEKANKVSGELCEAAIKAAGQTYNAPSIGENICQNATSTSTSATSSTMPTSTSHAPYATPSGTNTTNTTSSTTAAATTPASYAGAAAAVGALESLKLLAWVGLLGLGGVAIMAL